MKKLLFIALCALTLTQIQAVDWSFIPSLGKTKIEPDKDFSKKISDINSKIDQFRKDYPSVTDKNKSAWEKKSQEIKADIVKLNKIALERKNNASKRLKNAEDNYNKAKATLDNEL